MKRVFSGAQPTGQFHIGNYLGALRNWVKLQNEFASKPDYECLFCVVDLHALTQHPSPENLAQNIREVTAVYIACGINPEHSIIFSQSSVPQHAELNWILSCHTQMGWLNRMTQFKEKAGEAKEKANAGLFMYPVLMAADILLYKANLVPVGEDQKQHVELARDIAGAFNRAYKKEMFPLPEPKIMGDAVRIMSLRDGTKKMSKSDVSDYSRINMTDDADTIALKIRKAKTDTDPLPAELKGLGARPEADNLITMYAALSNASKQDVLAKFAGQQFSVFKTALADLTVSILSPISAEIRRLRSDPAEIDNILRKGGERALTIAEKNLQEIKKEVGLPRY